MTDIGDFRHTHVLVRKDDLIRIGRLAEKLGFLEELRALKVSVQGLTEDEPEEKKPRRTVAMRAARRR